LNHEGAKNTKKRRDGKERHSGSLIQRGQGETLAWCFLPKDKQLRMLSPDGTRRLVQTGTIIAANDPMEMRHFRIHSAEHPLHALRLARGLIICRVHLGGTIMREQQIWAEGRPWEKRFTTIYGSTLSVIWMGDAREAINRFAHEVPKIVLLNESRLVSETYPRQWASVNAIRAHIDEEFFGPAQIPGRGFRLRALLLANAVATLESQGVSLDTSLELQLIEVFGGTASV
jgi:hypothetical protein